LDQLALVERMIDKFPDFELARTADDIERIHKNGKIASLLGSRAATLSRIPWITCGSSMAVGALHDPHSLA